MDDMDGADIEMLHPDVDEIHDVNDVRTMETLGVSPTTNRFSFSHEYPSVGRLPAEFAAGVALVSHKKLGAFLDELPPSSKVEAALAWFVSHPDYFSMNGTFLTNIEVLRREKMLKKFGSSLYSWALVREMIQFCPKVFYSGFGSLSDCEEDDVYDVNGKRLPCQGMMNQLLLVKAVFLEFVRVAFANWTKENGGTTTFKSCVLKFSTKRNTYNDGLYMLQNIHPNVLNQLRNPNNLEFAFTAMIKKWPGRAHRYNAVFFCWELLCPRLVLVALPRPEEELELGAAPATESTFNQLKIGINYMLEHGIDLWSPDSLFNSNLRTPEYRRSKLQHFSWFLSIFAMDNVTADSAYEMTDDHSYIPPFPFKNLVETVELQSVGSAELFDFQLYCKEFNELRRHAFTKWVLNPSAQGSYTNLPSFCTRPRGEFFDGNPTVVAIKKTMIELFLVDKLLPTGEPQQFSLANIRAFFFFFPSALAVLPMAELRLRLNDAEREMLTEAIVDAVCGDPVGQSPPLECIFDFDVLLEGVSLPQTRQERIDFFESWRRAHVFDAAHHASEAVSIRDPSYTFPTFLSQLRDLEFSNPNSMAVYNALTNPDSKVWRDVFARLKSIRGNSDCSAWQRAASPKLIPPEWMRNSTVLLELIDVFPQSIPEILHFHAKEIFISSVMDSIPCMTTIARLPQILSTARFIPGCDTATLSQTRFIPPGCNAFEYSQLVRDGDLYVSSNEELRAIRPILLSNITDRINRLNLEGRSHKMCRLSIFAIAAHVFQESPQVAFEIIDSVLYDDNARGKRVDPFLLRTMPSPIKAAFFSDEARVDRFYKAFPNALPFAPDSIRYDPRRLLHAIPESLGVVLWYMDMQHIVDMMAGSDEFKAVIKKSLTVENSVAWVLRNLQEGTGPLQRSNTQLLISIIEDDQKLSRNTRMNIHTSLVPISVRATQEYTEAAIPVVGYYDDSFKYNDIEQFLYALAFFNRNAGGSGARDGFNLLLGQCNRIQENTFWLRSLLIDVERLFTPTKFRSFEVPTQVTKTYSPVILAYDYSFVDTGNAKWPLPRAAMPGMPKIRPKEVGEEDFVAEPRYDTLRRKNDDGFVNLDNMNKKELLVAKDIAESLSKANEKLLAVVRHDASCGHHVCERFDGLMVSVRRNDPKDDLVFKAIASNTVLQVPNKWNEDISKLLEGRNGMWGVAFLGIGTKARAQKLKTARSDDAIWKEVTFKAYDVAPTRPECSSVVNRIADLSESHVLPEFIEFVEYIDATKMGVYEFQAAVAELQKSSIAKGNLGAAFREYGASCDPCYAEKAWTYTKLVAFECAGYLTNATKIANFLARVPLQLFELWDVELEMLEEEDETTILRDCDRAFLAENEIESDEEVDGMCTDNADAKLLAKWATQNKIVVGDSTPRDLLAVLLFHKAADQIAKTVIRAQPKKRVAASSNGKSKRLKSAPLPELPARSRVIFSCDDSDDG